MTNEIRSIFSDEKIIKKIKTKLPYLFQLTEIDNSRDGKLGMEIGSARERIIIALIIYKFGEENVKTDINITKTEIDVIAFGNPISIKTITGSKISGIKLIWTVDPQKAVEFSKNYMPTCDIILIQINWNDKGFFYFFSKKAQLEVLKSIGRLEYMKLPKIGTNPRGVELSRKAIEELIKHKDTLKIEIYWNRQEIDYNPYGRWIEYWLED